MSRKSSQICKTGEQRHRNYSNWKQKWIERWNVICVKLIAILSFTCIFSVILVKSISRDNMDENNHTNMERISVFEVFADKENADNECDFNKYPGAAACYFTCIKKNVDFIHNSINIQYNKNECTGSIILKLQECYSTQQILERTWWKNNINVIQLTFQSCYFLDIEEGAFSSVEFASTTTIAFIGSRVHHYKKNMFVGLNSLVDLSIRDSNLNGYQGITFEFGVLEPISKSLLILQIQNMYDSTAVRNITGINLPKLLSIDFRFNTHLTHIPDEAFKTKNLETLYLSQNNLLEIDENVFKYAPKIANIFLENNQLKHLHERTFSFFYKHDNITISDNDWECNCNLKFLKIYRNINDLQITKCSDGVTLLKDIFQTCEDNLTTTTKTSFETKPVTKHTTVSSNTTNSDDPKTTITSSTTSSTTTITPEHPVVDYDSCQIMSNKFSAKNVDGQIMVSYLGTNFHSQEYYFFSSNEASCNFDTGNVFITKPDTMFIICSKEKNGSSELECFSERSPASYEEQVWMKNKAKVPLILTGIVVIIAAIISTGFGVFYWIQKYSNPTKVDKWRNFHNPTNILTNKDEFTYMTPKKTREISDLNKRQRFFNPTEGITYLTPIQKISNSMRSSSDSLKSLASYVSTDQMSLQIYSRKERIPIKNVFDDIPPLPPPRNRYDEIILHENEISHLYNL